MPIYEYRCETCAHEYEDLVRVGTKDEDVACPKCGDHTSERRVSVFATTSTSASPGYAAPSCGTSGFG